MENTMTDRLNKTVDFFIGNNYVRSSAFCGGINFVELITTYMKKTNYDKILIREWKDQKEVKSHTITFANEVAMNRIMTTNTKHWIDDIAIALTHIRTLHSDTEFLANAKERLIRLVTTILTDTEDYFSTK